MRLSNEYLSKLKGKLVQLISIESGREIIGYLADYDEDYILLEKPVLNAYTWQLNPAVVLDNVIHKKITVQEMSYPIPIHIAPVIGEKSPMFQKALFPKASYIIVDIVKDDDNEFIKESYKQIEDFINKTYDAQKKIEELKNNKDNLEKLSEELANLKNGGDEQIN